MSEIILQKNYIYKFLNNFLERRTLYSNESEITV